jgi:aspartyl/asparaginyl beta-hydroxylase (cupin superfamily)
MNNRNQENLRELFERFFDAKQAESCVEDIRKGEQILREHPAPEPDDVLIADIKAQIAMRLQARRAHRFRRTLYEVVGAAAAIIFIATVSLQLFQQKDVRKPGEVAHASLIPTSIWESDDITTDDQDLATFTTQIDQIEDEVQTLQSGQKVGNSESTVEELEMELVEINSDFWKG